MPSFIQHHSPRAVTVILAVACLITVSAARGQEKPAPPTGDTLTGHFDRFDFIFFAPNHPVVIRFQVRIGNSGITAFRQRYIDQLFRSLDRTRDGQLSRTEVTRVERLGEIAARFRSLTRTWKDFDTAPADDSLSPEEFSRVVQGALGTPFDITPPSRSAMRSDELFTRIDRDSDGLLIASEIFSGAKRLRRLDLNDDETFSIDELAPLQYEPFRAETQPFVALANTNHHQLVDRLIARYGRPTSSDRTSPDRELTTTTIPTGRLGLSPNQSGPLDRNRDDRLDRSELLSYLQRPTPHETIIASLPDPRTGRPQLAVAGNRGRPRLSRSWGGQAVQLRARNARSDRLLTTKFYRLRFRVADVNKNKYIEPDEFAQLMLPATSFAIVDSNGDGKLVVDELIEFIKDQTAVQQSRLLLGVSYSSRPLFELLDADADRRLSPREFHEGYPRLRQVDKTRDGRISRTDLSGDVVLTLEVARAALFSQEAMLMPNPQPAARAPRPLGNRAGPSWFQRMDRNADGDVSSREFLGKLALFKRLDRNGDRLISAQEAKVLEPNK